MARNNPVTQTLVTSGNSAILAAGADVSTLAVGQLGFFNQDTNLSIDGSSLPAARNFYIALGVANAAGTLGDIKRSAGQYIQHRNVTNLHARCYTAGQVGIYDFTDFKVECDTDYGIRFGLASQKAYASYGFNTPSKTFVVRSSCCDTCATCDSGDVNDMVTKLVASINADEDGLMVASFIASKITLTLTSNTSASTDYVFKLNNTTYTVALASGDTPTVAAGKVVAVINATTDTPFYATNVAGAITIYKKAVSATAITYTLVTAVAGQTGTASAATNVAIADTTALATFSSTYPGMTVGLRVTGVAEALNSTMTGNFNAKYDKPRGLVITPSLVEGFSCSGTITTTQAPAYDQGLGYDIAQMEYLSAGYNGGGVYRQSALNGFMLGPEATVSSATAKYVIITLTYDFQSVGGFGEYLNNIETVIAIPCGDAATLVTSTTGIADILDAIFLGKFETMSTYLGGCGCSGVNEVGDLSAPNADGISNF